MSKSINNIKKELGIPLSTPFFGWLIHNLENDDYLLKYGLSDSIIKKSWIGSPEDALKFKTQKKAELILSKLEVSSFSEVVPSFDLGSKILVACNS